MKLVFCKVGLHRAFWLLAVYLGTFALMVLATAFLVIGWDSFRDLWRYHKSVILGSQLYGTGDQSVVSAGEIWRAIAAIPVDRAYAVPIALFGGAGLVIAGLVSGWRRAAQIPLAGPCIRGGAAALLLAPILLQHYYIPYTAGVSPTLPAVVFRIY